MTQPYKICPRCQTPAALETQICSQCGRQYRTQFVPPQQPAPFVPAVAPVQAPPVQVTPSAPASNRRFAVLPGIVACLVILLAVIAFKIVTMSSTQDVVILVPSYMREGIPVSVKDGGDKTFSKILAGGREMPGMPGILMLKSRTKVRLLSEQDHTAHILFTSGPEAGKEGVVNSMYLYTGDADGPESGLKPLHARRKD